MGGWQSNQDQFYLASVVLCPHNINVHSLTRADFGPRTSRIQLCWQKKQQQTLGDTVSTDSHSHAEGQRKLDVPIVNSAQSPSELVPCRRQRQAVLTAAEADISCRQVLGGREARRRGRHEDLFLQEAACDRQETQRRGSVSRVMHAGSVMLCVLRCVTDVAQSMTHPVGIVCDGVTTFQTDLAAKSVVADVSGSRAVDV